MKGYKITNNDKCKNQLYEVGKTYQIDGELIKYKNEIQFCKNPDDLFKYYPYQKNITKIFEIEILGKCVDGKIESITDKLKVVREIPLSEYNNLFKNYQFNEDGGELHYKDLNGDESWSKYDNKGNEIHYKTPIVGAECCYEYWKEYDDKSNLIHFISSFGDEKRCEYDDKGNLIHYKDSKGFESWKEYDDKSNEIYFKESKGFECWSKYDEKGNKINFKDSNGYEQWYEYDNNGNLIYCNDSNDFEQWYEYDNKGNLIHRKNSNGYEYWFDKNCNRI